MNNTPCFGEEAYVKLIDTRCIYKSEYIKCKYVGEDSSCIRSDCACKLSYDNLRARKDFVYFNELLDFTLKLQNITKDTVNGLPIESITAVVNEQAPKELVDKFLSLIEK